MILVDRKHIPLDEYNNPTAGGLVRVLQSLSPSGSFPVQFVRGYAAEKLTVASLYKYETTGEMEIIIHGDSYLRQGME